MIEKDNLQAERLITPTASPVEEKQDRAIRPKHLADYVGQPHVREQMEIFIQAAQQRNEPLDHTLVFGPPGLGKTTLANIIATEMGVELTTTSGPVLEKAGDIAALMTNLQPGDVLFIDEIHRLSPVVEEVLYPAMEDYQLDIMIGEGPAARSIKLELPPFTLVGATTRAGLLTSPLRDRFGIVQRLEFYSVADLSHIVSRSASLLGVEMDAAGAGEIADSFWKSFSLSFTSIIKRSAVFLPTPGIFTKATTLSLATQWANSSADIPERIPKAILGPTPFTLIKVRNNCRSSLV